MELGANVVTLGYIAILSFSMLLTFFYVFSKTGKIKYAVIACLFVIKFITLSAWVLGLDRPLFTIFIYHRASLRPILRLTFTANMSAFLSSLAFTIYVFSAKHLLTLPLPKWAKDILVPRWVRE